MPNWFRKLRRTLSWHRRAVAACFAAIAVIALAAALRPPDPPRAAVVVAAAELPGGVKLSAEHLRIAQFPLAVAPAEAQADPAELIGRTLVAPLSAGSPVTSISVVSDRLGELAPGSVIAPIRIDDPDLVGLLRPGERVDILGVGAGGRITTLADGARLVSVPQPDGGGGLMASASAASLVLVEVPSQTALALTEAAAAGPLAVVLR